MGTVARRQIADRFHQSRRHGPEIALSDVRSEASVGQRTTFDILNAQQTLLNTRVAFIMAQRDRIVASYAILTAIGLFIAADLGIRPHAYDPTLHFDQVEGCLFGTDTP